MNFYKTLPDPPNSFSAAAMMIRLVDGFGFRYQVATEGLTENEYHFRPIEGSMNLFEVNRHIYQLIWWVMSQFEADLPKNESLNTFDDYRNETLIICENLRTKLFSMNSSELEATTIYLKRVDKHFSVFYLLNGPLADALTHVGQINSWRRMAGNPVPRVSPFTGEPF